MALVVAGFVAFLAWSTLSRQQVECEVCVEFRGQRNCATASAASEGEAARQAQTTACGTISQGMAESVMCGDVAPASRRCRTS